MIQKLQLELEKTDSVPFISAMLICLQTCWVQVVGGLPEDTPDAPDIPTVKGHELLGGPQMIQLRYVTFLVAECVAAFAAPQEHFDECHNACLSHVMTTAVCQACRSAVLPADHCCVVLVGNDSKKAAMPLAT